MYFCPYGTSALNAVQNTALLANILTLFVGIMLIIDKYLEDAATLAGNSYDLTGRNIVSVLILLVNISVVCLPILVKLLNSDALKKRLEGIFSSKLQKLKPEMTSDSSNPNFVFSQDKYLENFKTWA